MADGAPLHGVRRAGPEDVHRLERIVREVHGDATWPALGMTAAQVLSSDENRIYLVTTDGRAVGCLIASGREYTMLHCLSVLRPHRGHNYATTLIRAALADAGPDWALSGVVATVAEHDRSGRERFLRLGFRQLPHYVNKGHIALALPIPTSMRGQSRLTPHLTSKPVDATC